MKKMMMGLMMMVLALGAFAESHTWTLVNGKTYEGEFKEMKDSKGRMTVFIALDEGRMQGVPLARLSEEDQAFAQKLADEAE